MRGQKGITLVALIITIVVLLILAVVSITAINNTDLIEYTNNVSEKWDAGKATENSDLAGFNSQLNGYLQQYK